MIEDKLQCEIRSFSIWTRAYEKKRDKGNGFELGNLRNDQNIPSSIDFSNNGAIGYGQNKNKTNVTIFLKMYENVPGFSAMQLESHEELFEHINIIYDLMYNHYVLAKGNNARFPRIECCPSAQNLMVAGLIAGYPNASILDSDHDHCYNAFPFLLGEEKGLIIADPTSDQLWWKNENKVRPRNHLFVVKHGDWRYETNWARGANLYPDGYISLDSFKRNNGTWDDYRSDINGFFDKVFSNPIRVRIKGD